MQRFVHGESHGGDEAERERPRHLHCRPRITGLSLCRRCYANMKWGNVFVLDVVLYEFGTFILLCVLVVGAVSAADRRHHVKYRFR